jgi:fructose-specific phosphotransferase system IIB component
MKIIAVTSCPVGMAHTYMASAALKKTAKEMGHDILVETQGSMGIRDKISPQDIAEADIFINAADIAMEEGERFDAKPYYKTTTSKLIKKCPQEMQNALDSIK